MGKGDKVFQNLSNVNITEAKYIIGISTEDPKTNAYCIAYYIHEEEVTILLCKSAPASIEFTEEIENLKKYFNAEIYEQ